MVEKELERKWRREMMVKLDKLEEDGRERMDKIDKLTNVVNAIAMKVGVDIVPC